MYIFLVPQHYCILYLNIPEGEITLLLYNNAVILIQ